MLDVLIPHIVHITLTYFDYTFPILQNFENRHILKSILKKLEEKNENIEFFENLNKL